MRKNLVIVYIAFFLSLGFLVILSLNFYQRLRAYRTYSTAVEQTYTTLNDIAQLQNYLKDAETAQRGYLLTEDSSFLKPYIDFVDQIEPTYHRIYERTQNNRVQIENLSELKYSISRRMEFLKEALILFKSDRKIFVRRLKEGKKSMDECRTILTRMQEEELRTLNLRNDIKEEYESSTSAYSMSAFVFALIVFIITFLLIIREFRRRLIYQRRLERTIEELNQNNQELEQITFVASHDLQEPLRKILTFSDLMSVKHAAEISPEGQRNIERIRQSSLRMQGLVEDLVNFTNLATSREKPERVSLKDVIEKVRNRMRSVFEEKDAKMSIDFKLPTITGYTQQLHLLFECLLENAIKFSKPDTAPTIFIITQDVPEEEMKTRFKLQYNNQRYIKVIVRDNGLGFDNQFSEKIFGLFQRLHLEPQYNGKGIGLAMVRRVMANHSGYVTAHGKVNEGAEFSLYFPVY